nr:MAG TPA: hypothetical protein [Caudoviricetes sp.]
MFENRIDKIEHTFYYLFIKKSYNPLKLNGVGAPI